MTRSADRDCNRGATFVLLLQGNVMSSRKSSFRPRIEALEERTCLSATFPGPVGAGYYLTDNGHTLVIKGNDQANEVKLYQDDSRGGLVIFTGDTGQVFSSSAITRIVVDLGRGDDVFTYQADSERLLYGKK